MKLLTLSGFFFYLILQTSFAGLMSSYECIESSCNLAPISEFVVKTLDSVPPEEEISVNLLLDGSNSYDEDADSGSPNNGISNYSWQILSSPEDGNPTLSFNDSGISTTVMNVKRRGTYLIELTVTDHFAIPMTGKKLVIFDVGASNPITFESFESEANFDSGEFSVRLELGAPAENDLFIPIKVSGDAEFGVDHDLSGSKISILKGKEAGELKFNILSGGSDPDEKELLLSIDEKDLPKGIVEGEFLTHTIKIQKSSGSIPIEVKQVVTGSNHSCALLSNGKVKCWGENSFGQLGYGHTSNIGDNEFPSDVNYVNLPEDVAQLAAKYDRTCALLINANVHCWGKNKYGEIGNGTTETIGDNESPYEHQVIGLVSGVDKVALGRFHTCVLLNNGKVACWGRNNYGQLGMGHTQTISNPTMAGNVDFGDDVEIADIMAGEYNICVQIAGGGVKCWGRGDYGVNGQGNTNHIGDDEKPSSVPDISLGDAVDISMGNRHACALLFDKTVRCWGDGSRGKLGNQITEIIGDDELPIDSPTVDLGFFEVTDLSAGELHTCVLADNDNVFCWGQKGPDNSDLNDGRLGLGDSGDIGDDESPLDFGHLEFDGKYLKSSNGGAHSCGLNDEGGVRCFGFGLHGQLGRGTIETIGDDESLFDLFDILIVPFKRIIPLRLR